MRQTACLFLLFGCSWAAHADSDPENDTYLGADVLALSAGFSDVVFGNLVDGDDVDYWAIDLEVGAVLTLLVTPLGEEFDVPDAALFVLDTDGTTVLTFDDDDGAAEEPIDEQNGSTVRFRAPVAGTYYVAVSGCCTILGSHEESGPYALLASWVQEDAPSFDTDPANDELGGAQELIAGIGTVPTTAVQVGELVTPARGPLSGDLDFYAVDLLRGDALVAVTSPLAGLPGGFDQPNTELALVDPSGVTLLIGDDAGSDLPGVLTRGSALRYRAAISGRHYLVVSGDDDENQGETGVLDGAHQEVGRYALTAALLIRPRAPIEVPIAGWLARILFAVALLGIGATFLRRS